MFRSALGAVLVLVLASGCSQKCDTCETIEKNDSLVTKWINAVAKQFDGATYQPGQAGASATVSFSRTNGGFLAKAANAAGGMLKVNGKALVEQEISNQITCVADNSDGQICRTCPKKPKIVFNCGQACGEDSEECEGIADDCFNALLKAAVANGYHPKTKNYNADRVRKAMNDELAQNNACAGLKGFHSKCGASHTEACGVDATQDPLAEGSSDVSSSSPGISLRDFAALSTEY